MDEWRVVETQNSSALPALRKFEQRQIARHTGRTAAAKVEAAPLQTRHIVVVIQALHEWVDINYCNRSTAVKHMLSHVVDIDSAAAAVCELNGHLVVRLFLQRNAAKHWLGELGELFAHAVHVRARLRRLSRRDCSALCGVGKACRAPDRAQVA